jgi:hypothetical protein
VHRTLFPTSPSRISINTIRPPGLVELVKSIRRQDLASGPFLFELPQSLSHQAAGDPRQGGCGHAGIRRWSVSEAHLVAQAGDGVAGFATGDRVAGFAGAAPMRNTRSRAPKRLVDSASQLTSTYSPYNLAGVFVPLHISVSFDDTP